MADDSLKRIVAQGLSAMKTSADEAKQADERHTQLAERLLQG